MIELTPRYLSAHIDLVATSAAMAAKISKVSSCWFEASTSQAYLGYDKPLSRLNLADGHSDICTSTLSTPSPGSCPPATACTTACHHRNAEDSVPVLEFRPSPSANHRLVQILHAGSTMPTVGPVPTAHRGASVEQFYAACFVQQDC
jgi:hypothetical protein